MTGLLGLSQMGRNGDTQVAHLTPGEVVIPKEVAALRPDLVAHVANQIRQMGGNPQNTVVGRGRINPQTGIQEFATEAEVQAAYQSNFGRAADPEGLKYWMGQDSLGGMQGGAKGSDVDYLASHQAAAPTPAPAPSTGGYFDNGFGTMVSADPTPTPAAATPTNWGAPTPVEATPAGVGYPATTQGTSTGNVNTLTANAVTPSASMTLKDAYQQYLGRTPDDAGYKWWMEQTGGTGLLTADQQRQFAGDSPARRNETVNPISQAATNSYNALVDTRPHAYTIPGTNISGVTEVDNQMPASYYETAKQLDSYTNQAVDKAIEYSKQMALYQAKVNGGNRFDGTTVKGFDDIKDVNVLDQWKNSADYKALTGSDKNAKLEAAQRLLGLNRTSDYGLTGFRPGDNNALSSVIMPGSPEWAAKVAHDSGQSDAVAAGIAGQAYTGKYMDAYNQGKLQGDALRGGKASSGGASPAGASGGASGNPGGLLYAGSGGPGFSSSSSSGFSTSSGGAPTGGGGNLPANGTLSVADDETVLGRFLKTTAANTPLDQMARTSALQQMAGRGLLNSSLAITAADQAAYQAALPIANADANLLNHANEFNANWTNQNAAQDKTIASQMALADKNNAASLQQTAMQGQNQKDLAGINNSAQSALNAQDWASKIQYQNLDNTNKVQLANIDAQFRTTIQTQASAADLQKQIMANIANIQMNTSMDSTAKQTAISSQLYNYKQGLAILGKAAGISGLGDLLNFTGSNATGSSTNTAASTASNTAAALPGG